MMTEDIRDIKGVLGVFDLGTLIFFVVVFIVLLALVYCAYRYYQKAVRRRKPQKSAGLPITPFNQIAEEAISALDPVEYFQKSLFREYYFELTGIVRRFLADNYKIDALEKTSYELIEEMERVERDYERIKLLDRFMQSDRKSVV